MLFPIIKSSVDNNAKTVAAGKHRTLELFHCKMIGRVIFRTLNKPGNKDVFPMMCKTLQVSTFCTESGVKQNIRDIAKNIDTTLTAEQKEYVDKLKKKIRGGVNSPRCNILLL